MMALTLCPLLKGGQRIKREEERISTTLRSMLKMMRKLII
jgi:hypothetical protein